MHRKVVFVLSFLAILAIVATGMVWAKSDYIAPERIADPTISDQDCFYMSPTDAGGLCAWIQGKASQINPPLLYDLDYAAWDWGYVIMTRKWSEPSGYPSTAWLSAHMKADGKIALPPYYVVEVDAHISWVGG
ncbi:hypothetical protein K1720_04175 [Thermococcus argininiproducens]|uniref:DUF3750 domain-containing protein n=1 Tax=Thermococcus argininiproducens TaxID=2866384 RepID=A0A9E7MBC3_9EURY|nr:hypothetical protein [Thermococcus argininiproducens]USH00644.1 hypothetical protein K1720_04175 [Thermococcus argininiproducens]